jgi:hypothetical protein
MISRYALFGSVVMETRHVGTRAASGQSRFPRFDATGASDQDESVTTTYHLLSALHRNLLVTAVTRETPEDRHLPNKFDYQTLGHGRPHDCYRPSQPLSHSVTTHYSACIAELTSMGSRRRLRRRASHPEGTSPGRPDHDTARGLTAVLGRGRPGRPTPRGGGAAPGPELPPLHQPRRCCRIR